MRLLDLQSADGTDQASVSSVFAVFPGQHSIQFICPGNSSDLVIEITGKAYPDGRLRFKIVSSPRSSPCRIVFMSTSLGPSFALLRLFSSFGQSWFYLVFTNSSAGIASVYVNGALLLTQITSLPDSPAADASGKCLYSQVLLRKCVLHAWVSTVSLLPGHLRVQCGP